MTPRFPAEWEPHEATWIAWPWNEEDWPGKFQPIRWVYAEIVRALAESERVEIIVRDKEAKQLAQEALAAHMVSDSAYRFHILSTDRSWLRDSAPTAVQTAEGARWVQWNFNGWAKYDNYLLDRKVPALVSQVSEKGTIVPVRPDNGEPVVLEGGAIETDGEGTMLVTEECLLSEIQCRNPGLTREGYEQVFQKYLGIEKTIWLEAGCAGDDTHGHIDDIARFTSPGVVVLAYESNEHDPNHLPSKENLARLQEATDAKGRKLKVVTLPYPKPVLFEGQLLPASYANFYIANKAVIVPTFNDPNDRVALNILAELFPEREIVGIHAVDLVLGLGTLHCLSQQQPR